MRDAIAIHTGIVAATAVSLALAIASHESLPATPVVELTEPPDDSSCTCGVASVTDSDEQRALALACRQYSDDACRHRFDVFATARHGDHRGVFVRRSTGGCGGCGAFTVAVIFRGDGVEIVDKLGEYGRFGNGPDAIRFRDVVGHSVLEVDDSISMGGYTSTYREYFILDGGRAQEQICLQIAESDAGARERASEWTSNNWIAAEGTMYFVPDYTKRGEVTPPLRAFSFPFEHGRWVRPDNEGRCIDPRMVGD